MLGNFEKIHINDNMKKIIPFYDNKKYDEINKLVDTLKGSSGYIGAARLFYVCHYMLLAYNE